MQPKTTAPHYSTIGTTALHSTACIAHLGNVGGIGVVQPRDVWVAGLRELGFPLDGQSSLALLGGDAPPLDEPRFLVTVSKRTPLPPEASPELALVGTPSGTVLGVCLGLPHPAGETLATTAFDFGTPAVRGCFRQLLEAEVVHMLVMDAETGIPFECRELVLNANARANLQGAAHLAGTPAPATNMAQAVRDYQGWCAQQPLSRRSSGQPAGRNAPCPCGAKHPDGRSVKYKHCCGR